MSIYFDKDKMKLAFQKMTIEKRMSEKLNYEWLLNNQERVTPNEDQSVIDFWKSSLELLNEVIQENL